MRGKTKRSLALAFVAIYLLAKPLTSFGNIESLEMNDAFPQPNLTVPHTEPDRLSNEDKEEDDTFFYEEYDVT